MHSWSAHLNRVASRGRQRETDVAHNWIANYHSKLAVAVFIVWFACAASCEEFLFQGHSPIKVCSGALTHEDLKVRTTLRNVVWPDGNRLANSDTCVWYRRAFTLTHCLQRKSETQ